MDIFYVIGGVVALVFLGFFLSGGESKSKTKTEKKERKPIKAKRVLTMNEQPTFLALKKALPDHHILAQVSFSAFLTAEGFSTRSLFNRKMADFVVLDKSFNMIAVVELDDSSHKGREHIDQERDSYIQEAGYRVFRYKRTPSLEQIQTDILG